MDKLEILKEASKNLIPVDYKNIFRLVNELGLKNINSFKIHEGVYIFRIRPSEKTGTFKHTSEISFNPNSVDFGRANKPGTPMFYGSFAAPGMQNPILTNALEILSGLSKLDNKTLNEKYIITNDSIELTVGKWKIEKAIPVVPMIFYEEYLLKNEIFRTLYIHYLKANKGNQKIKDTIHFIASEFAKSKIDSTADYKISAAFTEFIFKNLNDKVEAIIYPSVRSDGEGFNIAISPKFVHSHLKLHSVCIQTMYFKNESGVMDYDKIAETINKDGTFVFKDITDPDYRKGRDWCLNELKRKSN